MRVAHWEVSPGKVVQAWTFNGIAPGPRIDLEVGEKIQVPVKNDLEIATDVHWHGLNVAWLVARGRRRVRYRGVIRNQTGLTTRVAAINLRRLVNLGLDHNSQGWVIAT